MTKFFSNLKQSGIDQFGMSINFDNDTDSVLLFGKVKVKVQKTDFLEPLK